MPSTSPFGPAPKGYPFLLFWNEADRSFALPEDPFQDGYSPVFTTRYTGLKIRTALLAGQTPLMNNPTVTPYTNPNRNPTTFSVLRLQRGRRKKIQMPLVSE